MTMTYVGKGKVFLADNGAPATGLTEVGLVTNLKVSVAQEEKKLADFTAPGGGTYNKLTRVTDVTIELSLRELLPENLSKALYGTSSKLAAGNVSAEMVTVAALGALLPLTKAGASSVVVKNQAGSVTYVAGTDYRVTGAGIIVLPGGSITASQQLSVSYSYPQQNLLQALTTSGGEYRLVLDGLNEAESGKAVMLDVFRVKFSPTDGLEMIGDDFATLTIKGAVLKDTSKTGVGVSQYLTVAMVS